ncbi:glycoside hydrolase, partial [Meira miltonrushii]
MLFSLRTVAITIALSIAVLAQSSEALKFGIPWGADSRWAPRVAKGRIQWYHHWQDGPVAQMPKNIPFVPMFWGPRYYGLWNQQKKWIRKHKPKFILSLNEPDIEGQANVSPKEAARLHMKELEPFRRKGHKVSSPQIVWNTKWMDSFLKHIRQQGGDIDFIAAHYYGSWKDVGRYQKWIKTLRKKYKKSIWITEYGVTSKSGGSQHEIKAFQRKVNAWMRTKKYVKRVAWLGCFAVSKPPDAFASRQNALFTGAGKLRSIGYQYVY